jgi:AraC family transcriptional regulator
MQATLEVTTVELDSKPMAALLHVGPYSSLHSTFQALNKTLKDQNLEATAISLATIMTDDPKTTPPPELRSHVAVQLPDGAHFDPPLEKIIIPAGKYATAIHKGSYAGLGQSWGAFMAAVGGGGVARRMCFEIYRNTPGQVAEAELITEMYIGLD